MKTTNKFAGAGVLTAIAASLCCITPVLALISGASGVASSFSWMEPVRPYLIAMTILVLAFAWYQKLKPRAAEKVECACEVEEKPPFTQTKKFLGIVTVFAFLMMAFPHYSSVFYSEIQKEKAGVDATKLITLNFEIEGMTCESCNLHVAHAIQKIDGVFEAEADFTTGKAEVKFDPSQTTEDKIVQTINDTGYKVAGKSMK